MYQTINIFPTTIYVGELENHLQYKKKFYDVDSEFNYRNSQWDVTSENTFDSFIHLNQSLDSLFSEIVLHIKKYIFGSQGKDYAKIEKFRENNIEVFFQNYNHPSYDQIHGNFKSNLSVIDLLFNCGKDALSIILNGQDNFKLKKNYVTKINRIIVCIKKTHYYNLLEPELFHNCR